MKVLMTADTVGGVWTYAIELAAALAPRGVRFVIVTMGRPPTADQQARAARAGNVRLEPSTFRLEWMQDPWDHVDAAGEWLLDLERRERPDVVHLNGYAHGRWPFETPKLVVGHSCVLSWWRAVHGYDAPPEWDRYRRAVRAGLRGADLVVAPTAAMLGALIRYYGHLPRSAVIHNGRDPADFPPLPKRPVIAAAGRLWDEAKNISLLCRAAQRLSWPVEVAGDDRAPDGVPRPCPGVRALGRLPSDALARHLGRASIFAHPAKYEPFGLAPLEAALAGCALVLGDIPSLREVWADAAVYIPPDNADTLADAVSELIRNAPLRDHLAAAARERALAYSRARFGSEYLGLYQRLTHAAPAAAPAPAPFSGRPDT